MSEEDIKHIAAKIKSGYIGIIPTDTVYGIVTSVYDELAINRVYEQTGRPSHKACIVLINSIEQLDEISIKVNSRQKFKLNELWPGPNSIILSLQNDDLAYLHKGNNSLAVRIPDLKWLRELIKEAGPIIATSANKSGLPTPDDLSEIKEMLPNFDFYIEGRVKDEPSRLALMDVGGNITWLERSSS